MNRRRLFERRAFLSALVVACVAVIGGERPTIALEVSATEETRLAAGEILVDVRRDDGADAAEIMAVVDIGAPADTVWAIMTDCARAPKFVPDLISCKVLESDAGGAWDVREHKIDWAWFLPTVTNVFRSEYEGKRRLRFHRVGGDLKESSGEWRLEPLHEGRATRVFYSARLAPNGWIPAGLVRNQMREDIPKVLAALRRECLDALPK